MNIDQSFQTATQHHRAGRFADAERLYRAILSEQPDHADALHRMGALALQARRFAEGCEWINKAIAIRPAAEYYADLAVALSFLRETDRALAALRQAIATQPTMAGAHANLGTMLQDAGKLDEAVASFHTAIALSPQSHEFHFCLGNALMRAQKHHEAINAFNAALKIRPNYPAALVNLGSALRTLSWLEQTSSNWQQVPRGASDLPTGIARLEAAAEAFGAALRIDPRLMQAHVNLANVLSIMGRYTQAIEVCRRGIALQPAWPDIHSNLSIALRRAGDVNAAIAAAQQELTLHPNSYFGRECLARALQHNEDFDPALDLSTQMLTQKPDDLHALNMQGEILWSCGRSEEAAQCYAHALQAHPFDHTTASSRLFTLQFFSEDPQFLLAEHRKWDQQHAAPFRQQIRPFANPRDPERRLRIGYVSPYFLYHCQALFTTAPFVHHDRHAFEIYAYSLSSAPDPVTEFLKTHTDAWRDVSSLSDPAIADLIRNDQIDVLVDLTMHMSGCQPMIFARKPAPVQVAWLAYPGTTGIATMDYRLTDPHLDPPGFEDRYTEQSLRLPDTFWCYDPHTQATLESATLPPPGNLPALKNGFVTFGSLNHFAKTNAASIHRWGRLMQVVPHSRLRLLSPHGRVREQVAEQLAKLGVAADRIDFVDRQGRSAYLSEYQHIDLCLDTLPYNGHTTSLDAFWMGVPVLTQVGPTVVGRAGFSQLSNLQLDGFVAESDEQFIELGQRWASNLSTLAEIRRTLRDRMEASPLMDGKKFARGMEAAYRQMWTTWCR